MKEPEKRNKILIVIPLLLFAVMAVSFFLAGFLEAPTGRGDIYTIFISISLVLILMSPLPCSIAALLGIYYAKRASGSGKVNTGKWIALGMIEFIFYVLLFVFTVIAVAGWQSV